MVKTLNQMPVWFLNIIYMVSKTNLDKKIYSASSNRNRPANTNRPPFRNRTHHILIPIVTAPHLLTAHIQLLTLGQCLHGNALGKTQTIVAFSLCDVYMITLTSQKFPLWIAFSK